MARPGTAAVDAPTSRYFKLLQVGLGPVVPLQRALELATRDLETIARYDKWCDCARDAAERAFLERLNDDRNPALADRIAALHA